MMTTRWSRPRLRPLGYSVCFVVGGGVGALWDQLHVQAGTLEYTDTTLAGQAWWVPLQFGLVYAIGIPVFIKAGDPAPSSRTKRLFGLELVWATACYAATAFFHEAPWLLAGILLGAAFARAGALKLAVAANAIPAFALLITGPLVEAMLAASGVFAYTRPQLGPIPVWLPLLYLNLVPFVVRAAEAVLGIFGVRRAPATA